MAHRSKLIIGSTSNVKIFELTIKTFKKHVEGGLLLEKLMCQDNLISNEIQKFNRMILSFKDLGRNFVPEECGIKLNMRKIEFSTFNRTVMPKYCLNKMKSRFTSTEILNQIIL